MAGRRSSARSPLFPGAVHTVCFDLSLPRRDVLEAALPAVVLEIA
ncbi:hypothetical protein ABZ479_32945 [Streptomyces sp. NPDC005722]